MKVKIDLDLNSFNQLYIVISTERLKICSVKFDYKDMYYQLFSNKKTMKFYEKGVPFIDRSLIEERLNSWIKRWDHNDPYSGYSVFNKDTNEFIGHIDFETSEITSDGDIELGYIYPYNHWGKGFGTESVSVIINHVVPYLLDKKYTVNNHLLKRIVASTQTANIASQKILEKMGFIADKAYINRYGTERIRYYLPTENIKRVVNG